MPHKHANPTKRKILTIMRFNDQDFEEVVCRNSTMTIINHTRKALIDAKLLLAYESNPAQEIFYVATGALDA